MKIGYPYLPNQRLFTFRLELTASSQGVTAQIVHFINGPVLQASTTEWAIRKNLFKTTDTSAYVNLARVIWATLSLPNFLFLFAPDVLQVFAQRCLESGLTEMMSTISGTPNGKVDKFLKTLESEGVRLEEAEQYKPDRPWNLRRPEKPWEVTEWDRHWCVSRVFISDLFQLNLFQRPITIFISFH